MISEIGMKISVRVTPNAKKTELLGIEDGVYRIKLKSPPVDGKANQCLIEFLASHFKVRKSCVRIVSGDSSRQKIVEIVD